MTKLERIIRQVSDLRDFYIKVRTAKKRKVGHAKMSGKPATRDTRRPAREDRRLMAETVDEREGRKACSSI